MVDMVRNAVLPLDEHLDPRASPQIGVEALRAGPADQSIAQIELLVFAEKAGASGMRHRGERLGTLLADRLPPAIDTASRAAQPVGHFLGPESFVQQRHRFAPALLQLLGTSMCSHALSY